MDHFEYASTALLLSSLDHHGATCLPLQSIIDPVSLSVDFLCATFPLFLSIWPFPSWGDTDAGLTLQEHTPEVSEPKGSCWERWRPRCQDPRQTVFEKKKRRRKSWNTQWSGWDRRRTRDLIKNMNKNDEEETHGEGTMIVRHSPLTMKPLISSLNRLTSHDTNTPPPGRLRIVWLLVLLLLGSQDPIPDTADTGRHLMRMESEDKGGSEAKETWEELTMREMGSILSETESREERER
jgi:hypothetical protein